MDDGTYGKKRENGEWGGMVRELIDGKADIAVADLTITYEREGVVVSVHILKTHLNLKHSYLRAFQDTLNELNLKIELFILLLRTLRCHFSIWVNNLLVRVVFVTKSLSNPLCFPGIGILYQKPKKEPPKLFSFMSPLAVEVWIYLVTAFLGVTLCLFVIARFSPYEWINP